MGVNSDNHLLFIYLARSDPTLIFSVILVIRLSGHRDIAGGAEVGPGEASDRPEAGRGSEDADIVKRVPGKVPCYRTILSSAEIRPAPTPDRPQARGGAEDCDLVPEGGGGLPGSVPAVSSGNRAVASPAEVGPG